MQNDIHKLKNKHILVTGGAGFIGSNLCHYLVTNKIKVTCLDNLITPYTIGDYLSSRVKRNRYHDRIRY